MFDALRKMILPIIVIVLVFFLGMIVLQWGLDITRQSSYTDAAVAGVINGQEISWDYFGQVFDRMYQSEADTAQTELTDSRIRSIRNAAWNDIVGDVLLQQEADKRDIKITDQDIYISLRTSPPPYLQQSADFQTDGKFDYQKYLNIMAEPQASFFWKSLEPQVRKELKRIRVQQQVIQTPHVTEDEVRQAYMDANETVKVGMINVQMGDFSNQIGDPTDSVLQAYFDEHKDDFTVDERRVLSIVKFAKEPSAEDDARVLAQATLIYDSAKAGADFAELARNWSEDPGSAKRGGDLGWVSQGRMVPEFDSVAFSMKDGQISPPFKSMFGYHIVEREGTREEESPSGDKIEQIKLAHILFRNQPSDLTLSRGLELMDTLLARTKESNLEAAAEGLDLEVHQTKPLEETARISYLGNSSTHQMMEWAFKAEVGAVSNAMENDDCYCIIRVDEMLPPGPATFEDAKRRVRSDYRYSTAQQLCRDTIASVYADIQEGVPLETAAYRHDLDYDIPQPFSRSSSVPDLVNDPTAIGAAFSLTEKGERLGPLDYKGGTVIMELLDRHEPDLTQYNEQRDSIYSTLLNTKQQKVWQDWFTNLHENSDIVNNVVTQEARHVY